jgi:hypothetical protein
MRRQSVLKVCRNKKRQVKGLAFTVQDYGQPGIGLRPVVALVSLRSGRTLPNGGCAKNNRPAWCPAGAGSPQVLWNCFDLLTFGKTLVGGAGLRPAWIWPAAGGGLALASSGRTGLLRVRIAYAQRLDLKKPRWGCF